MNRVFILGSGFSKAIHSAMPTMAELSDRVVASLSSTGRPDLPGSGTPLARNFEAWLSYLASQPPWLTSGDLFRNKSAFEYVTEAMVESLTATELRVKTEPLPGWLANLVAYWQATSSTVITFNYDTLVEAAWSDRPEQMAGSWVDLYPVPLTPAAHRVAAALAGEPYATGMRLLKLHGSLSWYFSGSDAPPGDIVYDMGVARGWSAGSFYKDDQYVSDKVPLIVPPTAVKSPYYGNGTIRALWHYAAAALSKAEEVVVMGFSAPVTDLVVGALLSTSLDPEAVIVPVNPDDRVLKTFRELLGDDRSGQERVLAHFVTDDAIERWVETCAGLDDRTDLEP